MFIRACMCPFALLQTDRACLPTHGETFRKVHEYTRRTIDRSKQYFQGSSDRAVFCVYNRAIIPSGKDGFVGAM